MPLCLLIISNIVFIAWGVGLAQRMQHEVPWWRRRFRLLCTPHPDHVFWITRMRRGFTWEQAECSAHTFTLWQFPSAFLMALRLGARWSEIWVRWI